MSVDHTFLTFFIFSIPPLKQNTFLLPLDVGICKSTYRINFLVSALSISSILAPSCPGYPVWCSKVITYLRLKTSTSLSCCWCIWNFKSDDLVVLLRCWDRWQTDGRWQTRHKRMDRQRGGKKTVKDTKNCKLWN